MIIKQYIKDFENLGFGMFVHFGLYSILGTGEWSKHSLNIADEDYELLKEQFEPKKDWATELVKTAKNAGCKYITLTTRHHDGFSLYDTCGLNDYDAHHSKEDLNYKSPAQMIRELADCRRYGANMLMNIGPTEDGSVREIDRAILNLMGKWVSYHDEALRRPRPTGIEIEGKPNDFILRYENNYYLFCYNLPMSADFNVALYTDVNYDSKFVLKDKICKATWLDNGAEVSYVQEGEQVTVTTEPFTYGRNLVVRIAKLVCED